MSFKRFLAHHAHDLANIANALSTVVTLLPIGRQDRENINAVVAQIAKASDNVAAAVKDLPDGAAAVEGAAVEIGTDALQTAVERALPGIVGDIAERVFHLAKTDPAAVAIASGPKPSRRVRKAKAKSE